MDVDLTFLLAAAGLNSSKKRVNESFDSADESKKGRRWLIFHALVTRFQRPNRTRHANQTAALLSVCVSNNRRKAQLKEKKKNSSNHDAEIPETQHDT